MWALRPPIFDDGRGRSFQRVRTVIFVRSLLKAGLRPLRRSFSCRVRTVEGSPALRSKKPGDGAAEFEPSVGAGEGARPHNGVRCDG